MGFQLIRRFSVVSTALSVLFVQLLVFYTGGLKVAQFLSDSCQLILRPLRKIRQQLLSFLGLISRVSCLLSRLICLFVVLTRSALGWRRLVPSLEVSGIDVIN